MADQQIPFAVDEAGVLRRFGTLVCDNELRTAYPLFEQAVNQLSDSDIMEIARAGMMDGRTKFDQSWIDDQKSHGSCNGFAESSGLAKARVKRGLERVDLSGAYAYSLMNGGQDQGSSLENGMLNVSKYGICKKSTVGWDQIYPNQYDKAKADAEAAHYKGFEAYAVGTIKGAWNALALDFILICAVHVNSAFMRVNAAGVAGVDRGPGNHAVHCDGITLVNDQLAGTGANNWNVTYGQDGRMLLVEAHWTQPFQNHKFYAIRSTLDGGTINPPVAG